ncbi:hypothetical protein HYH03_013358 [Edaphochlamys debaryana]|uniref:C3H1-type domain-containing protein n=1 Tax=Edaphochlamys debaryana TaxID=47281 RepID=A0A836BUJ8_9CHLO|nr:hypothetical protein HYH03_013358 [Edaphochlamys debaryana]|eukprot:KAG2488053.1 hypothetical protein HYH03_013358 [Edaphochlamys debaryana]
MDFAAPAALAQLTQHFQEANLGPAEHAALKQQGELLSSAEATTQYSSSESSSGADNLNCQLEGGSLLDSFPGTRTSDAARTSVGSQEGKAQICFDFTKGVCSRGDKCKYSHDLATIVHFNSKEKGICFDYLRNQCHRGLLCRFSHDLSNIAQQCQAYNNGAKENKGAKPNAICYDFVKGVCQRGAECRYSHDLSLIARMARGGSAQPKAGEVCYDYLRGRCNRGSTCKYSHNIAFLAAPGFLGGAMSDGAPMAGQAPGSEMAPGSGPLPGMPMGGPGFMHGMPGMPSQRLATAMSADQATFNHVLAAAGRGAMSQMLAAQAAMQPNGFAAVAEAAAAAVAEGRRRSASLTGEAANDTLTVNDQPPPSGWHGMPPNPKALAMAQHAMMSNLAVQHRMAAVAANMQAFGHMHMQHGMGMHGGPGPEGLMGPGGMYVKPPGMGQFSGGGGPDGAPAMRGRPPLAPTQGVVPPEFAALLAGGMQDNPQLLAETLAAAAKAQAQSQNARMMAAAAAAGNGGPMMQGGPGAMSMSSGGSMPSAAAPQPIPGRESNQGYDAQSYGEQGQSNGGAASENGALSRSAPNGGPNAKPDLLLLQEIWAKPGAS